MIAAVAISVLSVIALVAALVGGGIVGYRRGHEDGARETVHRLLMFKNPEMWDAAHSLMVDLKAEPGLSAAMRTAKP